MRASLVAGTLALALVASRAQAQAVDPAKDALKVGAGMYKLLTENERVRIMEVTFKPGAEVAMHCHPDHVGAVVSGGKLKLTPEKGQPQDHDLAAGAALYIPAECHSAKNVGTTEVKVVVVELKEKSTAPPAAKPAAADAKAAPATAPSK